MRILIVKHGALGDVVRTSYFAGALRRKYGSDVIIDWITSITSFSLLRYNFNIDNLYTSFDDCCGNAYSFVYSLDDEQDVVERVMMLSAEKTIGAIISSEGLLTYSDDASPWFDMGLLSKFGREYADAQKKINDRSHADIFSEIFQVADVHPEFYGSPRYEAWAQENIPTSKFVIGINPFAGGRWPSKELRLPELQNLITNILRVTHSEVSIVLLGAYGDHQRNLELAKSIASPRVYVPNTDESVLKLAAVIGRLDYLVSSDSLALHLGIAQHIPFVAFFAPTSAAEIDTFEMGYKLCSESSDYCSYKKDADNASITSERILELMAPCLIKMA